MENRKWKTGLMETDGNGNSISVCDGNENFISICDKNRNSISICDGKAKSGNLHIHSSPSKRILKLSVSVKQLSDI